MRIAICDDILAELVLNTTYINEYINEKGIAAQVRQFSNPDGLLTSCETESFHIYLLDMVMPMMNGVQLGTEIRALDREAQIIYITTAPEFALDSFKVYPLEYLLKPLNRHKLFAALDFAISKINMSMKLTITVKTKGGIHTFPLTAIACCKYVQHTVVYTLINGNILETTTISGSFSEYIKTILLSKRFIKPHAAYVVNMSLVERLTKEGFFLRGGIFVPVSGKQFTAVRDTYLDYQLEKEKL